MIRDGSSKALVNNDVASLNKYKLEREKIRRIEQLSKDMVEVKKILSSVCDRLDKIESV